MEFNFTHKHKNIVISFNWFHVIFVSQESHWLVIGFRCLGDKVQARQIKDYVNEIETFLARENIIRFNKLAESFIRNIGGTWFSQLMITLWSETIEIIALWALLGVTTSCF